MGQPGRAWYTRVLVLVLAGALYVGMWSSYVYFNAEVVHNGDRIKLRDAAGNFVKSEAVQVSYVTTSIVKKLTSNVSSGVLEESKAAVPAHAA